MKYSIAAVLSGVLISVMIWINAQLTDIVGNYHATVYIHICGLIPCVIIWLCSRQKLHPAKRLPILMYMGGVVGVATVLFNNASVLTLGVSITLALGLLGQLILSLLMDRFGLLGVTKRSISKSQWISASLVLVGIAIMMIGG